jgi:N-methylhydantoinase A
MIESGPVAGLVGCHGLGERMGVRDIIAADMGGTTFKVGIVRDGRVEYQRESMVLRHHYALPKLDVVSLGLAGGSVVSVDERTGVPHIGPRSAGSYPGPVCYGHGGGEATVTDVDAILGYLNPDFFLGGRARLDIDLARALFEERVAAPLGMELEPAAAAIYRLANSRFFDLLHRTTVQRGLDPRRFALFSFGGTAGMHVAAYAEELGVAQVVIPHSASVHGAFGLTTSNIVHEDQLTRPMRHPVDEPAVAAIFDELEGRALPQLREEGFGEDQIVLRRAIDMRYRRQVHILTVPHETGEPLERAVERFEALYRERYGAQSAYREAGIELVSFRLRAEGIVQTPEPPAAEAPERDAAHAAVRSVRAWVEKLGESRDVTGYDFDLLDPGDRIAGPAIVWTPITTLVLGPGHLARMDDRRSLVISFRPSGREAPAATVHAGQAQPRGA